MEISFNNLRYGNLNRNDLITASKKCLGDKALPSILKQLSKLDFPENYSKTTRHELNEISSKLKSISSPESKDYLQKYLKYDRSIEQSIASEFHTKGVDVEDLIFNIIDDIEPVIFKLKEKFQRPRPFQLGNIYKLKIFPFKSYNSSSPSYPSGHAIIACVILNVIGNRNPEFYEFSNKLKDEICKSRIYLGLNYQSDIDASYFISDEILNLKEFIEKYKL